jgi:hypothetical protein
VTPKTWIPLRKPKKKRVASEKQRAHLAKIQPKATEAKKKKQGNRSDGQEYEAVKKPIHDYTRYAARPESDQTISDKRRSPQNREAPEPRRIVDKAQVRETGVRL